MSDTEKPALDLDALSALCDAATPRPWKAKMGWVESPEAGSIASAVVAADGRFIAAAREAMPALIASVRELEAKKIAVKRTFDADLAYARNDLKRAEAERDILQAQLNEMLAMDERRAISGNLPVSRSNGGKGTGPA